MVKFAVVIPSYNSAQTLDGLLTSLSEQTSGDFEVVVVDDASTDETCEVVRDHGVRYACLETNSGPAAARNRGAELTESEWIVFADADTEFLPETVERIGGVIERSDADALVGSYAGMPANAGFVPRYKALWEYAVVNLAQEPDERGLIPLNVWAPRPGVVRRTAFEAVGGFDTRFRGADLEDLELGRCLSEAGYRIYFAPEIRIKHHYPASVAAELKPFARRSALWMRMMVQRRNTQMDSVGEGSPKQALAHMFGFGAFCFLVAGVLLHPYALVFFGVAAAGTVVLNATFLGLAFREEGVVFALKALAYSWLHSIVLGFAAVYGLATSFKGAR